MSSSSSSYVPQVQATRTLTLLACAPGIWKCMPTALLQELQEMFYPLMTNDQVLQRLYAKRGGDCEATITAYPLAGREAGRETYPVHIHFPAANANVHLDYKRGHEEGHVSYHVHSDMLIMDVGVSAINLTVYKQIERDIRFVLSSKGKVIAYGRCQRCAQQELATWLKPMQEMFERLRMESGMVDEEVVSRMLELRQMTMNEEEVEDDT